MFIKLLWLLLTLSTYFVNRYYTTTSSNSHATTGVAALKTEVVRTASATRSSTTSSGPSSSSNTLYYESPSQLTVAIPPRQPPDGLLVVSTLDGNLHAIDLRSGNEKWVFAPDTPLLASTQTPLHTTNADLVEDDELQDTVTALNNANLSTSSNTPFVIPATDGSLFFVGQLGLQRLPITVNELIDAAPFRTKDNTRFVGKKVTTAMLLDKQSGKVQHTFTADSAYSNSQCYECHDVNDTDLIWLGKTEMNVRALDGRSGRERWNVSVSSYSSMFEATERELTTEELDKLQMPKFAVSVDGELLAIDTHSQRALWQHSIQSMITAIHFIPHLQAPQSVSSEASAPIADPNDMMRIPHYYFDASVDGPGNDYTTAALNHYYRRMHDTQHTNQQLLYIGKTPQNFYYALHSTDTQTTKTLPFMKDYTGRSAWYKSNQQVLGAIGLGGSDSMCSPGMSNYPQCLTGFHYVSATPALQAPTTPMHLPQPHIPLAIGAYEHDARIASNFLPAPSQPNASDYPHQLNLPAPAVSSLAAYWPVMLTSAFVSLSVTLPLLAAMYMYRRSWLPMQQGKGKRKKKQKKRGNNSVDDNNSVTSPQMSPVVSPTDLAADKDILEEQDLTVAQNGKHDVLDDSDSDTTAIMPDTEGATAVSDNSNGVMNSKHTFASLSSEWFQLLCADLLAEKLNLPLQRSRIEAADDVSIDHYFTRSEDHNVVVQAKHCASWLELQNTVKLEAAELAKLKADRYVLATSLDLTADQKDKLRRKFTATGVEPDALTLYDLADLNGFLDQLSDIRKKWYPSTAVSETSGSRTNSMDSSSESLSTPSITTSNTITSNGVQVPVAHPVKLPAKTPGHYTLNKILIDTTTVLGTGSMGTVVYAGQFEGRACAIKRLVKPFYGETYADIEIALLIATDQHPNMLRYYAKEEDTDFIYIALERCTGTLLDMVSAGCQHPAHGCKHQILHDMCRGLAHLHALNIVHRDLKPANILLSTKNLIPATQSVANLALFTGKISDMGLGKKLELARSSFDSLVSGSVGWQPPEVLRKNDLHTSSVNTTNSARLTKAVDIFSAGCVLHYVLTDGLHPFGDTVEREYHILQGKIDLKHIAHLPEAVDLIASMCAIDPAHRLSAEDACNHPFFMTDDTKLQFLSDVSDRIEVEAREDTLCRLTFEAHAADVVGTAWDKRLHSGLIENLGKFRKYDFKSIRDCLRVIRNKRNHFRELPLELQSELGEIPSGFLQYFTTRFPKLLLYSYAVTACFAIDSCPLPYITTNERPVPTAEPPINWQTSDNFSNTSLSDAATSNQPTLSLSTPLCQIQGLVLHSSFKPYYSGISLKRLIYLQQLTKLRYRNWYGKEEQWLKQEYVPLTG